MAAGRKPEVVANETDGFSPRVGSDCSGGPIEEGGRIGQALAQHLRPDLREFPAAGHICGQINTGRALPDRSFLEASAQVIIRTLTPRRIAMRSVDRDFILACTDIGTVDAWADRAASAETRGIAEVFGSYRAISFRVAKNFQDHCPTCVGGETSTVTRLKGARGFPLTERHWPMNLLLSLTATKVAAEGGVTAHEPNL